MSQLRLKVQQVVKHIGRMAGVEIRYAFQFPSVSSPGPYQRWLSREAVKLILDVGANTGQSAVAFAESFPNAIIHSFEPFKAPFDILSAAAERSGGRIKAHQFACGAQPGTIDVEVASDSTSQLNKIPSPGESSHDSGGAASGQTQRINVTTVDAFCAEHQIDRIDILKTDTEGYDSHVIAGAEQVLRRGVVRCVISEVGFLDDPQHTHFDDVYTKLRDYGFDFAGLYEITYHRSQACDFANALFVDRRSRKPE